MKPSVGKFGRTFSNPSVFLAALAAGILGAAAAYAGDATPAVIQDGTIGYALTGMGYEAYTTKDGKAECPNGLNAGPRDQYRAEFSDKDGPRTVAETHLKRERDAWFPQNPLGDPLPYYEVKGTISYGMNLDGTVGPNDFTSPEGEKGIKNQLYRAIGCTIGFRGGEGGNSAIKSNFNRLMIELKGVNNLKDADKVDVTIYRGRDALRTDATGKRVLPGGSERIDAKFGASLIYHLHGKIVDGVLTTEPSDVVLPYYRRYYAPGILQVNGMRMRLKLTPDGAEGMLAGYSDIDVWYDTYMRSIPTLYQSVGGVSAQSVYQAIARLADGYPDPKTGKNTAISSALEAKFVQVFIKHDPAQVASVSTQPGVHLADTSLPMQPVKSTSR